MPVTPFHFGPGLLLKGAASRSISFCAFALSQVLIDCEVIYFISQKQRPLHGFFHTGTGALLAGGAAALALLVIVRLPVVRKLPWFVYLNTAPASLRSEISTAGILIGGLLGGLTHPLLDALMHRDVCPFSAFIRWDGLWQAVSMEQLHNACLLSGAIGAVVLLVRIIIETRVSGKVNSPASGGQPHS